jgi:hypothetical protein
MADPAYPGGLPDVPLEGSWDCSDLFPDPITTDMGGNNVRSRQMAGRNVARMKFTIMYTQTQYNTTLVPFWKTNLGLNFTRHTMRVWNGGAMVGPKTVRWAGKPKPQTISPGKMQVSYDLWVYNFA